MRGTKPNWTGNVMVQLSFATLSLTWNVAISRIRWNVYDT
jgi:hypothetical protein